MAGTGHHPEGHNWVPVTEFYAEYQAFRVYPDDYWFCLNCACVAKDRDRVNAEWECIDDC